MSEYPILTDCQDGLKKESHFCYLKETQFKYKMSVKIKGWEKMYHENTNQNEDVVDLLVSEKVNFRAKKITRDEVGCYLLMTK